MNALLSVIGSRRDRAAHLSRWVRAVKLRHGACGLAVVLVVLAQPAAADADAADPTWRDRLVVSASTRLTFAHAQIGFEVQDTRLAGLPDDAVLPPPVGALGPGAVYVLNTNRFAGIPTGGRRELAHVVDVAVTALVHDRVTLGAYYGHAFGQGVVRNVFAGPGADYGFVELTVR